jgi:hypothetical protein
MIKGGNAATGRELEANVERRSFSFQVEVAETPAGGTIGRVRLAGVVLHAMLRGPAQEPLKPGFAAVAFAAKLDALLNPPEEPTP